MTAGQQAAEARKSKFRSIWNRQFALMYGAVALGTLLIFVEPAHFKEESRGLGEALVIAGLLGLTVDSYLKRSLVREIGMLALRTLFGANAPQEYIDCLSDSLRDVTLVSLANDYSLRLEPTDKDALKVISEVRVELINVSTQTWESTNPQLAASKAGADPSQFTAYEITTRQPQVGQRAVSSFSQRFSIEENPEMAEAQEPTRDGTIILNREQLRGWKSAVVEPGGSASIRMKAITSQPRQGGMPFVTRTPALRLVLRVSGPALTDLEVVPYVGSHALQSGGSSDGTTRHGGPLDFRYDFVQAQSTIRVEWAPRAKRRCKDSLQSPGLSRALKRQKRRRLDLS